jgi:pimeloyl-ACP methyl ester carboxylesterase
MGTLLHSRNRLWFAISLILFLLSAVGASRVQTSGGDIEIKDMRWETPSGHMLSALLFKPRGVSSAKPVPAIVTSHGMLNSREMQDSAYVELARRGYVVVAIDMYGHGFSEVVTGPQRDKTRGTGLYDAVDLVATLPYVDKGKIGITGHSFGGRSANWSIEIDNKRPQPLVSAVLLQTADGIYSDPKTKKFFNLYGARNVGIIGADHDEFFFRAAKPDGAISKPKEFLATNNAQSFLHFGAQPGEISDKRVADTVYTQNVDGKDATRVIYMLSMTHPWAPFSQRATARIVEFFDRTFGAPMPIDSNTQVWQYKEAFNALGLIAFAIFLVSFTKLLLETRTFASLHREVPPASPLSTPSQRGWLWGGLVVSAIVSLASYMLLFDPVQLLQPGFRTQYPPLFIGIWAAVNGLFALLLLVVYYNTSGKRDGMSLRDTGVAIGGRALWLTMVLAIEVVAVAYVIVFAADYLFKVDFRLWVLGIKPFTMDRIPFALAMLPLFGLYFIGSSVALNAFQRFTLFGREWGNTTVVALFASLSGIAVLLLQYVTFYATGEMHPLIQAMEGIYMMPIVVILFVTAVIARKIYRVTNNPYLGGLINTLAVTLIAIANTQTLHMS